MRGLRSAIDCGTNIDLFKALAAMNDSNDREQWFVGIGGLPLGKIFRVSLKSKFDEVDEFGSMWRKATAEEIIEHFKNLRP